MPHTAQFSRLRGGEWRIRKSKTSKVYFVELPFLGCAVSIPYVLIVAFWIVSFEPEKIIALWKFY